MTRTDRIHRAIAFYLSVALFLALLPIVLSYALGYQIDYATLKIYKTGILYVNSNPAGASIYLNGRLYNDVTPAQIEELKPGTYRIEVRRDGFYPWERELTVRPNMVTKADRIVLFPVKQDMRVLGEREVADFAIADNRYLYCFSGAGLFRLSVDGSGMKQLSSHAAWPDWLKGKRFSPDGNKIALYNDRKILVVYLAPESSRVTATEGARVEEVFDSPEPIIGVFWYSQSNYLIVATESDIKVVELRGGDKRNIVLLHKFSSRPRGVHYDEDRDTLFFTDAGQGKPDAKGAYLYRLDLRQKQFDSFLELLLKREGETNYESK